MISPKQSSDTHVIDELNDEVEFLGTALVVARTGPWELYPGLGAIYLSPQWATVFGIKSPPDRFSEYLALIDPPDRQRVADELQRFFQLRAGSRWQSHHRLAGRIVHSRALLTKQGQAIGVDMDIERALVYPADVSAK